MKTVLLDGGLANQMTQYIFARCLQEANPDELVLLDDLWFYCPHDDLCRQVANIEHHEYQLDKFPNVVKIPHMSSYFDADVWQEIIRIAQSQPPLRGGSYLPQIMKDYGLDFFMIAEAPLYRFDGMIARMPYYHYMPEMLQAQGNAYYFGWFTHGGWFMSHEELFRHELALPPLWQPHDLKMEKEIRESTSVSLHIRRGGYAAINNATPEAYFQQAIHVVCKELKRVRKTLKRPPHFFVFSDEIEWCRDHAREYGIADIPYPVTYGCAERTDADNHCDMQLMAQCDIMILELNSVYSYMAALLNPKKDKKVINPNKGRGIF